MEHPDWMPEVPVLPAQPEEPPAEGGSRGRRGGAGRGRGGGGAEVLPRAAGMQVLCRNPLTVQRSIWWAEPSKSLVVRSVPAALHRLFWSGDGSGGSSCDLLRRSDC